MAKANSLTVGRYAWRPVINRWVIGRLGTLTRRRPVLLYYCEGCAHSAFVVPQNLFSMQRQLYDRQVTTDAPSAWRERGGPLYARSPRDPHF